MISEKLLLAIELYERKLEDFDKAGKALCELQEKFFDSLLIGKQERNAINQLIQATAEKLVGFTLCRMFATMLKSVKSEDSLETINMILSTTKEVLDTLYKED